MGKSRRATERHLPYWISQCYICHSTLVNAPCQLTPAERAGTRFTYPLRDEKLSWPWCWLYTDIVYLSQLSTVTHPGSSNHLIYSEWVNWESNPLPFNRKSSVAHQAILLNRGQTWPLLRDVVVEAYKFTGIAGKVVHQDTRILHALIRYQY